MIYKLAPVICTLLFGLFFINIAQAKIVKGYALKAAIWNTNDIWVCWENLNDSTSTNREWVRNAILNSWEKHSQVSFTGWGQCEANSEGIRIGVRDTGPHVIGLGSYLDGRKNGMILNFTYAHWTGGSCNTNQQWCSEVIAVHEFGHALGFAHEQNRPDTPNTCTQHPQGTNGDLTVGAWDLDSVMNYCNPKYNNHGKLSETDIAMVRKFYDYEPVVNFDQSSYAVILGNSITFDVSQSYDPNGDTLDYYWNLGDGTVDSTSLPKYEHIYKERGQYSVYLTVSDGKGNSITDGTKVNVYGFEVLLPAIFHMLN